MKCHGCNSLMVLDKQESGAGSLTEWHSCPLCGKVRLTSQPGAHQSQRSRADSQQRSQNQTSMSHYHTTRKGTPYFA